MYFRSKFIEISTHVSKPKLYFIENLILLHFFKVWQWLIMYRLSFGTDSAHVIDVTGSLIIWNENIDQNVQLGWEIFFYQWTVWA